MDGTEVVSIIISAYAIPLSTAPGALLTLPNWVLMLMVGRVLAAP